jgi:glucose-1-phosphate thymidylyltransferase
MASNNRHSEQEVIGLLPAGGQATRISPLPCSKELYPIGFWPLKDGNLRPKVVSHYLLEKMRLAGIQKAYFVLRKGKWDIPAYFGDGAGLDLNLDMDLGYLMMRLPFGVPYTLDQAYPFVRDAIVALGFPDILFHPEDMFKRLLTHLSISKADVVIGVFPFENARKGGMVDFDAEGRVYKVIEKPVQSNLRYSWCTAVWTPTFTEFMHQYLITKTNKDTFKNSELPMGNVIQAAIENGLQVKAEVFEDESYLDIGTPEDLAHAVRIFASEN